MRHCYSSFVSPCYKTLILRWKKVIFNACTHWIKVVFRVLFARFMWPLLRFPALSLSPGQIPAQYLEVRQAVGSRMICMTCLNKFRCTGVIIPSSDRKSSSAEYCRLSWRCAELVPLYSKYRHYELFSFIVMIKNHEHWKGKFQSVHCWNFPLH